jgi:hypothetical protein
MKVIESILTHGVRNRTMLGQRVGDVRVSRLDQHLNRQRDHGRFGHCDAWELLSVRFFPNAVATPIAMYARSFLLQAP